jgi:hypothetical protein
VSLTVASSNGKTLTVVEKYEAPVISMALQLAT